MSWKLIKKALTNPEMLRRLGIVLGLLAIYRFLTFVPVPIGNPADIQDVLSSALENQELLGFANIISGGALGNVSIATLGLGPYINASILLQLLTKTVPQLKEISKDGEAGRTKINQYTRMLSTLFAFIQGIFALTLVRQYVLQTAGIDITENLNFFGQALIVLSLTAGSVVVMWLGELITEQGVGNGISLIITAAIITQLPAIAGGLSEALFASGATTQLFGYDLPFDSTVLPLTLGLGLGALILTYIIVKLSEAQRIITVQYAKRVRGNKQYGGVETILPVKLIIAGVIPIIFAVVFLQVPPFIGNLMSGSDNGTLASIGARTVELFNQQTTFGVGPQTWEQYVFPVSYFILVVAFTYFYTGFVFSPKDISENLQKQGGFIAGVRPGKQTERYLKKIVNRLTLFGATALGFLAIVPFIGQYFTGNPLLTIGGSSLLILVSVALESIRQIESKALVASFDG